jgi:hypothetical protein
MDIEKLNDEEWKFSGSAEEAVEFEQFVAKIWNGSFNFYRMNDSQSVEGVAESNVIYAVKRRTDDNSSEEINTLMDMISPRA